MPVWDSEEKLSRMRANGQLPVSAREEEDGCVGFRDFVMPGKMRYFVGRPSHSNEFSKMVRISGVLMTLSPCPMLT
jgi:hypothetical protein